MVTIDIHNLTKFYGRRRIIEDLSITLSSPTRFGITGRNGSGKSTLIKILAGYTSPNEGTITFSKNEKKIEGDDVYQYVSLAAPYLELPTHLSWSELLDFHFSLKSTRIISIEEIKESGVLPLTLPLKNFSSGMMQRAKLLLAFHTQAPILLLDEPTELLDDDGYELYRSLLTNYTADRLVVIASNRERDFVGVGERIAIGG